MTQKLFSKSRILVTLTAIILGFNLSVYAGEVPQSDKFPVGPDLNMTPGKLCEHPTAYRYDEHIPYCERNVSTDTKNSIIKDYDQKLGFKIRTMPRGDFKIDHLIPLSIGGSNDVDNLWPQHKSVYAYSDPIESLVSDLMVKGRIKQVDAIAAVKDCKYHLEKCADIQQQLEKLLND